MTDLVDVIKAFMMANNRQLRTCLPAQVTAIDHAKQECVVQPMVKRRDDDDTTTDIAQIPGVPIWQQSANTGQFSNPVKIGDLGMVMISDRSLDQYLFSDGNLTIDPQDQRTHDLSDAIFMPGLYPYDRALGIDPRLTVMRHNAGLNNAQNPGENRIALFPTGDNEAIQLAGNRFTTEHATIEIRQDGSIHITSDQDNSLKSEIKLNNDGSVDINANDGTNINMVQGGKITINSPSEVEVNCATADVNCSGNATIDASNIIMQGGGEKMLSDASVNHATGLPQGSGCATIFGSGGST